MYKLLPYKQKQGRGLKQRNTIREQLTHAHMHVCIYFQYSNFDIFKLSDLKKKLYYNSSTTCT